MLLSYLNGWQKRLKNIGMLSNAKLLQDLLYWFLSVRDIFDVID